MPTGVFDRTKVKCGQCGGLGHIKSACPHKSGVEKGVRVRRLAPGVSGEDLPGLDPIPAPPGAQRIPVILDVRVIVTVEVRK